MTDTTGSEHSLDPQGTEPEDAATRHGPAYSVIQQQLIDARDRLDREVARLTRMHAFNARALRMAVAIDPRKADAVPSTKGVLGGSL